MRLCFLLLPALALGGCAGGPSADYAGITEVSLVEEGRAFKATTGKQYGSLELEVERAPDGAIVAIKLKARSVEAFAGQQIAAELRQALGEIVRSTVREALRGGAGGFE